MLNNGKTMQAMTLSKPCSYSYHSYNAVIKQSLPVSVSGP